MQEHWLERPRTIRLLWRAFAAVLALTVAAELWVEPDAHFAIEKIVGFGAWFGFLACAALILAAKAVGLLVKRPDTYYEEGDGHD